MLLYISIPLDPRKNVSGSSNTSFSTRCMPLTYSTSPSDSDYTPHPPPHLPAPTWSPWYPGWADPTITWIGAFPDSASPPSTSPLRYTVTLILWLNDTGETLLPVILFIICVLFTICRTNYINIIQNNWPLMMGTSCVTTYSWGVNIGIIWELDIYYTRNGVREVFETLF